MKAYRSMARHAERSLEDSDTGFSEFTILEALLSKGPLKVNDIGRRVNLTSGSITSAIDRLEGRGLVQRSADQTDGRARLVSLTADGRSLIRKVFGGHKQRMDAAADTLTKAERKSLIALLKKLGLGAEAKLERLKQ
ncbi:MAG TPA: MarR family transcriptional regulator [Gemmatimonadaceae bacterium]|nr:MarR family transcriptional regulator [Gemmatimonadaceae bacterium]